MVKIGGSWGPGRWDTHFLKEELTARQLGTRQFVVSEELEMMLRRFYFKWGSLLATLLFLAGTAQVARAHAILMESTPKANSTIKAPELTVELRFNDRIDGTRSRLSLIGPDGSEVTLTIAKQLKPNQLQSLATGLKAGAYTLKWNVLAIDGHITRGEIPFTVS
jgi:methionine-rich copper-binding protein CopC